MSRTLPTLALLVVVTIDAGCAAVNEVVADRDLVCLGTTDDLCIRAADAVANNIQAGDPGSVPVAKVTVTGQECAEDDLLNAHCWQVEIETRPDRLGCAARLRGHVYERHDGTLINEGYEGSTLGPPESCH
jgi:hypothetical protein